MVVVQGFVLSCFRGRIHSGKMKVSDNFFLYCVLYMLIGSLVLLSPPNEINEARSLVCFICCTE